MGPGSREGGVRGEAEGVGGYRSPYSAEYGRWSRNAWSWRHAGWYAWRYAGRYARHGRSWRCASGGRSCQRTYHRGDRLNWNHCLIMNVCDLLEMSALVFLRSLNLCHKTSWQ